MNEQIWGKSFFVDPSYPVKKAEHRGEKRSIDGMDVTCSRNMKYSRNFFVAEIDRIARYAIPCITNIKYMMQTPKQFLEPLPPFDVNRVTGLSGTDN